MLFTRTEALDPLKQSYRPADMDTGTKLRSPAAVPHPLALSPATTAA